MLLGIEAHYIMRLNRITQYETRSRIEPDSDGIARYDASDKYIHMSAYELERRYAATRSVYVRNACTVEMARRNNANLN